MTRSPSEALVVGGGLAGSVVALELARAGRRVVLLEKSRGSHDKVCGEFLSREALHYLDRHNIDPLALGAVPIRSIRLVMNKVAMECALPFTALSLSRRRLDAEMLRVASSAGVEVQHGACVESLSKREDLWHATLREGEVLPARTAFLATGKHDLRGWARPPGTHRGLVAFKMYYRLTAQQHASLGQTVELILFPGGYAGLQAVEDGAANLCLLVNAERLRMSGSTWPGVLRHLLESAPHLAERLEEATPLLPAPLALASIPYGHMQQPVEDGLWRIGDQAAVIPSFCGDGMAIALHSGALAAQQFLHGASPGTFQHLLRMQLRTRLLYATGLSRLLVAFPHAAQMVRLFPQLLATIALKTRIPEAVLLTKEGERA